MAKINVLVPVYNGEEYIKETLERILAQDYDDFDVLVCDNASTDRTFEQIQTVNDPRVRVYRNSSNLGMGGNWNRLLSEADGEYIIFVMSDDVLLDGALKKKADILDKHKNVVLVSSSSDIINEKGKKVYTRRPYKQDKLFVGKDFFAELFTSKNILGEPTNNMMRRSAVDKAGFFRDELWYTIDWDYWLRMTGEGDIYYIDEPLSGFRVRGSSATGKSTKETLLKDEQTFLEYYKGNETFAVTEEMFKTRRRNVLFRMKLRYAFIKTVGVLQRFAISKK